MLGSRCELLGDEHPETLETWNSLIALYEAWCKPEKAEQWRAKLPHPKPKEQEKTRPL
jgi:hypothetical protein